MTAAEPELRATWAPVADRWLEVVAERRIAAAGRLVASWIRCGDIRYAPVTQIT